MATLTPKSSNTLPLSVLGLLCAGGTVIAQEILNSLLGTPIPQNIITMGIVGGLAIFIAGVVPDNKIERYYKNAGFSKGEDRVRVAKRENKDYGYDLTLSVPRGLSVVDFNNGKEALENFLDAEVSFRYENKQVIASIYTGKIPETCLFPEPNDFYKIQSPSPVRLPVGYSRLGLEFIDFEKHHHVMVCGETGSGKSVTMLTMITAAIVLKNPKELILHLADFKRGVEFGAFKNSFMVHTFSTSPEQLMEVFIKLGSESEQRYTLFEQTGVRNVQKYNARNPNNKLPFIITFIDEFGYLEDYPECHDLLKQRLAQDRGAGIYYALSTQRPSREILPGTLKANIPTKIGLRTSTRVNSEIIIDQAGLENLPGRGAAILKFDVARRMQVMYIDEDRIDRLIAHTIVSKRKESIQNITGGIINDDNQEGPVNLKRD